MNLIYRIIIIDKGTIIDVKPIEEIQKPRYKAFYGIDDKSAEIVTVTPEEFEEYYDIVSDEDSDYIFIIIG